MAGRMIERRDASATGTWTDWYTAIGSQIEAMSVWLDECLAYIEAPSKAIAAV